MAKTVNSVISEARAILKDTDSQLLRYSTADLVEYFNNALLEARRIRPDLFRAYIGQSVPSYTESDLSSPFPIDEMFFPQFVHYVAGTAELRDDEFSVDARAVTLLNQFIAKMLTVA